MATVIVSMRPEISFAMKVPRGAYVRFPLGNPFGEPGRPDQQNRILHDLFDLVESLAKPALVELPYRWRRWL